MFRPEAPDLNIKAIVETKSHVDALDKNETFYPTILGLAVIAKDPSHGNAACFDIT